MPFYIGCKRIPKTDISKAIEKCLQKDQNISSHGAIKILKAEELPSTFKDTFKNKGNHVVWKVLGQVSIQCNGCIIEKHENNVVNFIVIKDDKNNFVAFLHEGHTNNVDLLTEKATIEKYLHTISVDLDIDNSFTSITTNEIYEYPADASRNSETRSTITAIDGKPINKGDICEMRSEYILTVWSTSLKKLSVLDLMGGHDETLKHGDKSKPFLDTFVFDRENYHCRKIIFLVK